MLILVIPLSEKSQMEVIFAKKARNNSSCLNYVRDTVQPITPQNKYLQ